MATKSTEEHGKITYKCIYSFVGSVDFVAIK